MLISNTERAMLRLNLQFFGDDGAGGNDGGTGGAAGAGGEGGAAGAGTDPETNPNDEDRIAKLVQSQVDRLMADERKKNAELQKKVDKLTKEKMSAEEIKKLEDEEREKALAEREKALTQKTNLIYAQQAVTKAGFGDDLEAVVDFVMGDSEEKTNERVNAFKTLVDKIVAAQVDKTFKQNGRTPQGGAGGGQDGKSDNSIAEKLGKARAEQTKQSNDILNHYYGGKK